VRLEGVGPGCSWEVLEGYAEGEAGGVGVGRRVKVGATFVGKRR